MHIIFENVTHWQMFILRILKYLKFQVFYLYIEAKSDIKKNEIATKLKKNNIEARPIWYPNHLQKKFKSYQRYKVRNATKLLNSSLCLPSSTNIKIRDLKKVIKVLNA